MISVTVTYENGSSVIYDVSDTDSAKVKRQISRIMDNVNASETMVLA